MRIICISAILMLLLVTGIVYGAASFHEFEGNLVDENNIRLNGSLMAPFVNTTDSEATNYTFDPLLPPDMGNYSLQVFDESGNSIFFVYNDTAVANQTPIVWQSGGLGQGFTDTHLFIVDLDDDMYTLGYQGYTGNLKDCNDNNSNITFAPDTTCDGDSDGYIDWTAYVDSNAQFGGLADCDDSDAQRNPGLNETLDSKDNDCDNVTDEGIINGTAADIVTTLPNVTVLLNGSGAYLGNYHGDVPVVIKSNNNTVFEFTWDADLYTLVFGDIQLLVNATNYSYLIVDGVDVMDAAGSNWVFYLYDVGDYFSVCFDSVTAFADFTADCSNYQKDVKCDGSADSVNGFVCDDLNYSLKLSLSGYNGVNVQCADKDLDGYCRYYNPVQNDCSGNVGSTSYIADDESWINPGAADACGNGIDEDCSGADASCSRGGGGGGGGSICRADWNCTEWSECSPSGTQTRSCTDENDCGFDSPAEEQECTYVAPVETTEGSGEEGGSSGDEITTDPTTGSGSGANMTDDADTASGLDTEAAGNQITGQAIGGDGTGVGTWPIVALIVLVLAAGLIILVVSRRRGSRPDYVIK